jgi:hypothetical protein
MSINLPKPIAAGNAGDGGAPARCFAILPPASNVEQNLQNDVDFQQARSSSQ